MNHQAPPSQIQHFIWVTLTASFLKLLLVPAYHSTDFEVHRHWLALTHTLPLSQWYSDETSPWTLDYPPFFAYFEHLLSYPISLLNPTMTHLYRGLNSSDFLTVLIHRLSVILSDVVLFWGVFQITKNLRTKQRVVVWVLVIFSPGLFIVDHLHFQYNGFLLGMLLLSLSALEAERDLLGGFLFAVLLCFKHLFAVAAPVYFVYLLRHYCRGGLVKGFGRLIVLGSLVVAVFAAAYAPFVYNGQIYQVFRRMFPFGRGLCHAYWAPNFWVFYIIFDKLIAFLLTRLGFNIQAPTASFTGGLVGDSSPFAVLPKVTPLITFIMVLLTISPCTIKAWRNPQPRMITRWVAYAYTCGFLFGWHVHEKASLHFVIPFAIIALKSMEDARHYFMLSIVSCYSLFPLLFEAQEYAVKVLLLLLYSAFMWFGFSSYFCLGAAKERRLVKQKGDKVEDTGVARHSDFIFGWLEKAYLVGIIIVEIWGQFLHPILLGSKLPFLPLMMISVYCAIGMMYSWIWQLRRILISN